MAAPIRPNGVTAFGKEKWIFVPTLTSRTAPPLADVNSASGLDITGYLYAEGFDGLGADTSRVTAPRRVLDTVMAERLGSSTWTLGDMLYMVDPQAAAGSNGRKAMEKFPEGTEGELLYVLGIDGDASALTVGDTIAAIIPVEFGPQLPVKTAAGEEGEVAIRQPVGVTGKVETFVDVVA